MTSSLNLPLPKHLFPSLLCFTFVDMQILKSSPDITTCHSNGYLYELKNKKVIGSLDINEEKASLVSVYYLNEHEAFVIFYLVFTVTNKLLIIKRSKCLQIVKTYINVKGFEVFDFKCTGYPQIEIFFLNSENTQIVEFPVKKTNLFKDVMELNVDFISITDSLAEKLQMVNMFIDELDEESNHIKKLCSCASSENDNSGAVMVNWLRFSSPLKDFKEVQIAVIESWHKIYGSSCIWGMQVKNNSKRILPDIELLLIGKNLHQFTYTCFPSSGQLSDQLFWTSIGSPSEVSIQPEQEFFIVGAFEIPTFKLDSTFSVSCYVSSSNFDSFLKVASFNLNALEVGTSQPLQVEQFSVTDIMSVITVTSVTRLTIETEDDGEDLLKKKLSENLGFKKVSHMKDKFFYCSSSYLVEVGCCLKQIAANPYIWKMNLYTRDQDHVYVLVNALYDLLPEKTTILCDQSGEVGDDKMEKN